MNDNNVLVRFWNLQLKVGEKVAWLPPLLARISTGSVFIISGWGKLHNLEKVSMFFAQLGIPAPQIQAPFVASVEFGCGLAVLLGLFTRLTTIPLIIVMIVAIATAKWAQLSSVVELFGIEEFLLIVLLFWLRMTGPGKISLDQLILKDRK